MASLNIIHDVVEMETTTDASGNAVFNFSMTGYLDRAIRLRADAFVGVASASHLSGAAAMTCEGIYTNKAGVLAPMTAFTGSVNPLNSNSTGEENAWPHGQDGGGSVGTCTATLTTSGTNIILTVNAKTGGGGALVGATVKVLIDVKTWGIQ